MIPARHLVIEPQSTSWSTAEMALLARGVGGIMIRARNIDATRPYNEWLDSYKKLVDQAYLHSKNEKLIVCVDHEGELRPGKAILRYPAPITRFPAAGFWGPHTNALTRMIASELKSLGINLVFSPVADVHLEPTNPVIGSRAFSSSPAEVARQVCLCTEEFLKNEVVPTAKHFPGHGRTNQDSHAALPTLNATSEQLIAEELLPFREAIRSSIPVILSAHLMVPAIDSELPATLSRKICHDLLRVKMGFKGVLCTDALGMDGILPYMKRKDFTELLVQADVDIILAVGPTVGIEDSTRLIDDLEKLAVNPNYERFFVESSARLRELERLIVRHEVKALSEDELYQHSQVAKLAYEGYQASMSAPDEKASARKSWISERY